MCTRANLPSCSQLRSPRLKIGTGSWRHDTHLLIGEELLRLNSDEGRNRGGITCMRLLEGDRRGDVLAGHKFGDGTACHLEKRKIVKHDEQ